MRLVSTAILVLVVACVLLAICRWIARRDPLAALIVQVGLALRLWAGLILFWISYLNLPFFERLQTGEGFWLLAPDARGYFEIAARAADAGVHTVPGWSPSPAFTRALGLWMRVVGVSPASALLLNVLAYVGVATLIVAVGSRYRPATSHRARLVPLVAFSLSPALVLFGTQTLKDQLFCFALAIACAGAWLVFRVFSSGAWIPPWRSGIVGLLMMTSATYTLAGIRPYVAFLMLAVFALVLLAITLRQSTIQAWVRNSFLCMGLFVVLWIPFRAGAGPYAEYYESRLLKIVGITRGAPVSDDIPLLDDLAKARQGFVESAGATNIAENVEPPAGAGWLRRAWAKLEQLLTGLFLLVVPVSILRWMSVVQLDGGRGLLLFTDIDTLFLDVTIAAVVLSVIRSWRSGTINWPCVLFVGLLCGALGLMMAYVVTNFGTLFRLRLIAASLLWLLPVAMVQPHSEPKKGGKSMGDARVTERSNGGIRVWLVQ